jgi:hypothetical protein
MCMCVGGAGGICFNPHPTLAGSATIYAKTTVHCSPDSSMPTGIDIFPTQKESFELFLD